MPPVEFAYFTPKTKTGQAHWIDFWNADLFDGDSHLTSLHANDQIRFRKDATTWKGGLPVYRSDRRIFHGVQASFSMPQTDYFLGIAKLSSAGAGISILVDGPPSLGIFAVQGIGVEIPIVLELAQGSHWISLMHIEHPQTGSRNHLWFHSITCFLI